MPDPLHRALALYEAASKDLREVDTMAISKVGVLDMMDGRFRHRDGL